MLVSVVTSLFNNAQYIGQTIESVLAQSMSDWEMIIVDDGSTDGGVEIAFRYAAQDSRIVVIQQDHKGSAAARNNGILHAQGRYLAILDSDDLWDAIFLEKQLAFMRQTGGVLVCSAHRRIDANNKEFLQPFYPPREARYENLLKTCSISCLTVLYDTKPFGKFYLKSNNLEDLRDDYVLWLEILKHCGVVYGNHEVLASYRITKSSKSSRKIKTIIPQYRVYRRYEHLGVMQSLYYLCCWAFNGLKKYSK